MCFESHNLRRKLLPTYSISVLSRSFGNIVNYVWRSTCHESEKLHINIHIRSSFTRHVGKDKCSLTSSESLLNNSSMALNTLYLKHAKAESPFPWTQSLRICSMADSNFQETLVLVGWATVRDAIITTHKILSRWSIFGRLCLSGRRLDLLWLKCNLAESVRDCDCNKSRGRLYTSVLFPFTPAWGTLFNILSAPRPYWWNVNHVTILGQRRDCMRLSSKACCSVKRHFGSFNLLKPSGNFTYQQV
jgi:hypothetical protein